MRENRAQKYGRNRANEIKRVIASMQDSTEYREQFVKELKRYSFKPRKAGEPKNEGCREELEEIDTINIENPVQYARLVKEELHLLYQKQRARIVMRSLLDALQ